MSKSGNSVHLSTFLTWNTNEIIGYETQNVVGKELVVKVWCRVCAAHSDKLLKNVKGQALKDADKYVSGTNYVTKYTVHRHLSSRLHALAVEYGGEPRPTPTGATNQNGNGILKNIRQPHIDEAINSASTEAYRKLLKCAYLMAVDGQPLTCFKTIVNSLRASGVSLISGTDSSDKAKEFVHTLAETIQEKISEILKSGNLFSVLSDGSQARKTGSEKEMVLIRVVRGGQPIFYCVALEDVDEYGDGNAATLKSCIDSVFRKKLKLCPERYNQGLVSATADGASVNTGVYNGLLTRLEHDGRPWLLKIHCVLHRVELAVGDSLLKNKHFADVKEFMILLYYTFKQSGKLKRRFLKVGDVLNVQLYVFPKVHGTRFVAHQRRGLEHLLNNWIVLMQVLETCIADGSMKTLAPKLQGILTKLKNFTFLTVCCLYKTILDNMAKFSLKLEKTNILAFEVKPAVEKTLQKLEDLLEEECPQVEQLAETESITFSLTVHEPENEIQGGRRSQNSAGYGGIECQLLKKGHHQRKPENREHETVSQGGITHINSAKTSLEALKRNAIPEVKKALEKRFVSFESGVYQEMQWVDPANWRSDTLSEINLMNSLADHFSVTLKYAGFQKEKLLSEWKDLKHTAKHYYPSMNKRTLWKRIFTYRRKEFPNVCLLVEAVFSIGVSNGNVEAGFSTLTAMLSDRRLRMKHDTMEDLLLIKANHHAWSRIEREELINSALAKYLSTRRKRKVSTDHMDVLGVRQRHRKKTHNNSDYSDSSDGEIVMIEDSDSDTESLVEDRQKDRQLHVIQELSSSSEDSMSAFEDNLDSGSEDNLTLEQ